MTLLKHEYGRNPLDILIMRENRSCKGCKFKEEVFGLEFCNHPHRNGVELKRCRFYQGVENENMRTV